jgi:hypothetical protein
MNRYAQVRNVISAIAGRTDSLLDVGCRDCVLKQHIGGQVRYRGLDLCRPAACGVEVVGNVEQGLPFKDGSFDFCVALDCLEHLNDLQAGAGELLRVARKAVLISLPNMAYVNHRLSFLLRGRLATGKYSLHYGACSPMHDRHRWVTVVPQTDTFMRRFAGDHGAALTILRCYESRKRRWFAALGRIAGLSPAWWVPGTLYVVQRADAAAAPAVATGGGANPWEDRRLC